MAGFVETPYVYSSVLPPEQRAKIRHKLACYFGIRSLSKYAKLRRGKTGKTRIFHYEKDGSIPTAKISKWRGRHQAYIVTLYGKE